MKTPRTALLPPFYTHPIGSLPRPQVVRDLLARRNELPADAFRSTLDDLVRFAIRLQEQAGLDVVSDGEWRRSQYIREFLSRVKAVVDVTLDTPAMAGPKIPIQTADSRDSWGPPPPAGTPPAGSPGR